MARGGYTAVLSGALRVCQDGGDRLAVLWLAEQGDVLGWDRPFDCSTSALCDATAAYGCVKTRGWVTRFLARMEAVGFLKVVDPGSKNTSRKVLVCCPIPPRKSDQNAEQFAEQVAEHEEAQPTAETEQADTEQRTAKRPEAPPFRDSYSDAAPKTDSEAECLFDSTRPAPTKPDPWSTVVERHRDLCRERKDQGQPVAVPRKTPTRKQEPGLANVLKRWDVDEALLVLDWAFAAPDFHARALRGELDDSTTVYLTLAAIFRATKFPDKLAAAEVWHDQGRPRTPGRNGHEVEMYNPGASRQWAIDAGIDPAPGG